MAEQILVVDDNPETANLLQIVMERQGYQVIIALSGDQALNLAQQEQPDLILMDIMMPEMDGLEATRQLRSAPGTAEIPIIIFTALTNLDQEIKGFEAGADDFVTKLATPTELAVRVRAVLARARKTPRGHLIGVMGVKGGVGVSTLALNLGITLHQISSERVIVADYRPGQGSIGMLLDQKPPFGMDSLLERDVTNLSERVAEQALFKHASGTLFLLASSNPPDATHLSKTTHFDTIARRIATLARFVVLDLGSALLPAITQTLPLLNELILIVEPAPHSVAQCKLFLAALGTFGIVRSQIRVVLVNRGGSTMQLSIGQVTEQLNQAPAVVFTPAAELAYQAAAHCVPIVTLQPDSPTAEQFVQLAGQIL